MGDLDGREPNSLHAVDSCLAEIEDMLSYCNDILSTGEQELYYCSVSEIQCLRLGHCLILPGKDCCDVPWDSNDGQLPAGRGGGGGGALVARSR